MEFTQRKLGRGRMRLEITNTTIKYSAQTIGSRYSFEVPVSEYSTTIENWKGISVAGYAAAIACMALLIWDIRNISDHWNYSPIRLIVMVILAVIGCYFFIQARAQSGHFYIVRNRKEPSRDIWLAKTKDSEKFLATFLKTIAEAS